MDRPRHPVPRRQAGDVAGAFAHDEHVGHRGADVLGGDVAIPDGFQRVAEGLEDRPAGGLVRLLYPDDALAAPDAELGHCVLVGHALAEALDIGQGLVLGSVTPHPHATERWPQASGMQRNDELDAKLVPASAEDGFVGRGRDGFEHRVAAPHSSGRRIRADVYGLG